MTAALITPYVNTLLPDANAIASQKADAKIERRIPAYDRDGAPARSPSEPPSRPLTDLETYLTWTVGPGGR